MSELLTGDRLKSAFSAPCLALSFLLELHPRDTNRKSMPGVKDSGVFYRLWTMLNTLDEEEVLALFSDDELSVVNNFKHKFNGLNWKILLDQDHIKELDDDDLTPLLEEGNRLYGILKSKRPNHTSVVAMFTMLRRVAIATLLR